MRKAVTCRDGVSVLMDYTEGLLPAARRKEVESHVGGCVRCQRFVRSYCETPRILRRATVTPMPADLSRRLRRKLVELYAPGGRPARR